MCKSRVVSRQVVESLLAGRDAHQGRRAGQAPLELADPGGGTQDRARPTPDPPSHGLMRAQVAGRVTYRHAPSSQMVTSACLSQGIQRRKCLLCKWIGWGERGGLSLDRLLRGPALRSLRSLRHPVRVEARPAALREIRRTSRDHSLGFAGLRSRARSNPLSRLLRANANCR